MHKVQMNSSASDTIRARVARFNEFDNGHVLFDYQKMTEAEFEERAKAASIKDPNDVYYVAIDNIMDPSTDVYWFQGKSYDYSGAKKALSDYQKAATSGLNSGRRPLNSSEEQTKVSGIVTIYSDFVDFKRSVSEHLLQTAVGDRAKLKFKWVGDNKVEVKAICSVADERKVKILLENSDVTKTITWNTSANSSKLNSSEKPDWESIDEIVAALKDIRATEPDEHKYRVWYYSGNFNARLQMKAYKWFSEQLKKRGCEPVYLNDFNDAMHQVYDGKLNSSANSNRKASGKAVRKVQMNSSIGITYPNGMPVSEIDLENALDYNFGTDRDKDINSYTDEEKQRAVNYWVEKTDRMLNSSTSCDDYVKLSTATLKRKLKDATPEEKKSIQAELSARGVYLKKSVNSSTTRYLDENGIMGIPGDTWTLKELAEYWNSEQGSDPCLDEYASFDDWVEDTISMMTPLNASKSVNSAIHPALVAGIHFEDAGVQYHMEHLSDTDLNDVAYFREENGKRVPIDATEFDKHFHSYIRRTAISGDDHEAMARTQAQIEDENAELYSSRKMNSSRKVGNDSMRKVIFRGKLNSSRELNSDKTPGKSFYANQIAKAIKGANSDTQTLLDGNWTETTVQVSPRAHGYTVKVNLSGLEDSLSDIEAAVQRKADELGIDVQTKSQTKTVYEKFRQSEYQALIFYAYVPAFEGNLDSSRRLNSAAGSNDVHNVLKAALAKTQLPNDFNYSTPRRTDDGVITTLIVKLPDGSKSWVDKCYIEGDLATGDWAFGSYAPDGHEPAADSFGFQTTSGLDTETKAVAWLKKQLEDCAKFYKENPPKRIARVLDSSRKRMNSSRTKLNASLVDTFLQYHDDAENYDHQSMNYDELYDRLTTYAKPGENPEGMNVDELFVRAPETEQRAMIALIDPENWREDFDSSRKSINSNRKVGNTSMKKVIFRGKLNSSRKPASKSARTKLNSSSWYWDEWDEYCDAIPVTPEMQKAVDAWSEGDGFVVEKALVPRNRKVKALLMSYDVIAMLFTRIPGGTSFDDEEILGWTGTAVNDDLSPYNLVDILEKAGVNSYEDAMNSSRKPASKSTRKRLNSSVDSGFEKYFDRVNDEQLADYYGIDVSEITDNNADIEGAGYGKVVGHYIPKSQYRGMFSFCDWDTLDILDDGTVGYSLGVGGGKGTVFYSETMDNILEMAEEFGLDSSRKLNASEEDAEETEASTETEVQDTGIEGGEDAAETAEILEDALIVQNPETKEVALFIADAEDEAVPEDVDVIAEVAVVADEAEVLDSSRRLKKFATANLNSSKSCLNSDEEGENEELEDNGTVAYDEIQLPDDTVVEVVNILVVQDDEGELGLFMPEDAEEAVPEGYEVVATATPAAEADVLDSSRRMKKSNAKKLNSSAKRKRR